MIDLSLPCHAQKTRYWFGYYYMWARKGDSEDKGSMTDPPSPESARLKRAVEYATFIRPDPLVRRDRQNWWINVILGDGIHAIIKALHKGSPEEQHAVAPFRIPRLPANRLPR